MLTLENNELLDIPVSPIQWMRVMRCREWKEPEGMLQLFYVSPLLVNDVGNLVPQTVLITTINFKQVPGSRYVVSGPE